MQKRCRWYCTRRCSLRMRDKRRSSHSSSSMRSSCARLEWTSRSRDRGPPIVSWVVMSSDQQPDYVLADADLHLAELVNRVLDRGAVITGEITISVAGVDLVFLGLQLVISAAENVRHRPGLMSGRLMP